MNSSLQGQAEAIESTNFQSISIQKQDFDLSAEAAALEENNAVDGAVVTFTGRVRNRNEGLKVSGLFLEHYPGMTEKSLSEICDQAEARWPIQKMRVIHRVGDLDIGDQIVYVGVSSAHRGASFEACEFVMDFLKTKAPFWKLEAGDKGANWVEARDADEQAAKMWDK